MSAIFFFFSADRETSTRAFSSRLSNLRMSCASSFVKGGVGEKEYSSKKVLQNNKKLRTGRDKTLVTVQLIRPKPCVIAPGGSPVLPLVRMPEADFRPVAVILTHIFAAAMNVRFVMLALRLESGGLSLLQ